MLELVGNLKTSLGEHIQNLAWMSDATKSKAMEKLSAFTVKVGYPDTWKDYSGIIIDPKKSYWENVKSASIFHVKDSNEKCGKPVDKAEWGMTPQTHGFDDNGRQFDKDGNMEDWWTKDDAEMFDSLANKLKAQFDKIVVIDSLHANGKLTLGENIADQGGLRVAYTAYLKVSRQHSVSSCRMPMCGQTISVQRKSVVARLPTLIRLVVGE